MITTVEAPPDLCELIDRYRATQSAPTSREHIDAHWALRRWGMEPRTRYVHGNLAASVIWDSLFVVPWPAEGPRKPVRPTERRVPSDQAS